MEDKKEELNFKFNENGLLESIKLVDKIKYNKNEILEINNTFSKMFGKDNININLFLGENGSGKTLFLKSFLEESIEEIDEKRDFLIKGYFTYFDNYKYKDKNEDLNIILDDFNFMSSNATKENNINKDLFISNTNDNFIEIYTKMLTFFKNNIGEKNILSIFSKILKIDVNDLELGINILKISQKNKGESILRLFYIQNNEEIFKLDNIINLKENIDALELLDKLFSNSFFYYKNEHTHKEVNNDDLKFNIYISYFEDLYMMLFFYIKDYFFKKSDFELKEIDKKSLETQIIFILNKIEYLNNNINIDEEYYPKILINKGIKSFKLNFEKNINDFMNDKKNDFDSLKNKEDWRVKYNDSKLYNLVNGFLFDILNLKVISNNYIDFLNIFYNNEELKKIINKNGNNNIINVFKKDIFFNDNKDLKEIIQDINKYINLYEKNKEINIYFKLENHLLNKTKIGKRNLKTFSGGELSFSIRFIGIINEIQGRINKDNQKNHFLILIDEPDINLHLKYQKEYIKTLLEIFNTLINIYKNKGINLKLDFFITTHSPFLISDIPNENIFKLNKNKDNIQINIENYNGKSFGANYIDIINNGFFFEKSKNDNNLLIGDFAYEKIKGVSEKMRDIIYIEGILKKYNEFNYISNKKENKDNIDYFIINQIFNKEIWLNNSYEIKNIKDHGGNFIIKELIEFLNKNKKENLEIVNIIGNDFLKDNLLYIT